MDSLRGQAALVLTAMTISAVIILGTAARSVERTKSDAAARAFTMSQRDPIGFVMREYGGSLALFRENSEKPYKILDFPLYLLSETDRAALQEGILVETEAELTRILEDWDAE